MLSHPNTPVLPASFAGLLDQLPDLDQVHFTGRLSPIRELDRRSAGRRGALARKTWRALCALNDYATCRQQGDAPGGFWNYCASGRSIISQRQVCPRESDTVTSGPWANERLFPVPIRVHPSGEVLMLSHIRIGSAPPAPRIYYLDRTSEGEGVLVGYIGPHLTNTLT